MVAALKDEELKKETYSLVKNLVRQLLHDEEMTGDVRKLLIKVMQDPEVRVELLELLKASVTSP